MRVVLTWPPDSPALLTATAVLLAVTDWVLQLMEQIGAAGAGLAIALENLFPPVPSEIVLPLTGFAVSRGTITMASALAWTTAGSLAGALLLYWIGAALGQDRMRSLVGRIPLVKVEDLDKTSDWFSRHGGKAVFFGRMVPFFRSYISIPAGVEKMSLRKFVLLTFAGSAIWNTIFVYAGYLLGENWKVMERYADLFSWLVLAVVLAAVGGFVYRRLHERRSKEASRQPRR